MWRGWILTTQGQYAEGIAQLCQGLTAYRTTGASLSRTHRLTLLAEAYSTADQAAEGLRVLAEAQTSTDTTGERIYAAEMHRIKGKLLLQQAPAEASRAERCFQQALAVARQQQAKSLELRATMNLSRLWQQQGKGVEAHALLAPVYGWFTEGLDTADLQEANTLLEELAG